MKPLKHKRLKLRNNETKAVESVKKYSNPIGHYTVYNSWENETEKVLTEKVLTEKVLTEKVLTVKTWSIFKLQYYTSLQHSKNQENNVWNS